MSAYLQHPGIPVLAINGTTQGPASFFLRLFERAEPAYPPEGQGRWGEAALRQRLAELADRRITQLVCPDSYRAWLVFLNEDLDEVAAFSGRRLPEPRYTHEQDSEDISRGSVVGQLVANLGRTTVVRLDQASPGDTSVVLIDDAGRRYDVKFERALRVRGPEPLAQEITGVDEVLGSSGRTWFIFRPAQAGAKRILAVQATKASWTLSAPVGSK